jgi:hypothetical protein
VSARCRHALSRCTECRSPGPEQLPGQALIAELRQAHHSRLGAHRRLSMAISNLCLQPDTSSGSDTLSGCNIIEARSISDTTSLNAQTPAMHRRSTTGFELLFAAYYQGCSDIEACRIEMYYRPQCSATATRAHFQGNFDL